MSFAAFTAISLFGGAFWGEVERFINPEYCVVTVDGEQEGCVLDYEADMQEERSHHSRTYLVLQVFPQVLSLSSQGGDKPNLSGPTPFNISRTLL